MKTFALIENGYVSQVIDDENDMSDEEWAAQFPPSFVWAEVTGVEPRPLIGWVAEYEDGGWDFHPYVAPPPPPPTADQLRSVRNYLLTLADVALNTIGDAGGEVAAVRGWRQALRDVPQQPDFPQAYSFPAFPEDVSLPASQQAAIQSALSSV